MKRKDILLIISILIIGLLFRLYITSLIPLNGIEHSSLLFQTLFNINFSISSGSGIFIGMGNILLLWLIGRYFFNSNISLIAAFLYSISPWTIYLDSSGSIYIVLIFALLVTFYSALLIKEGKRFVGLILLIIGSTFLFLASIFFWLILPLLIYSASNIGFLSSKDLKILLIMLVFVAISIGLIFINNYDSFKTVVNNNISAFNDVGLVNSVNQFQGETKQAGFGTLGRVVENRYLYSLQHLVFNTLKHFSPATYFTTQEKMFNFSFSSPIFLSLFFPFIMGIKGWFKLWKKYKLNLLSILILMLPSILSEKSPDLIKLSLMAPVILFTISYGIDDFFASRRKAINIIIVAVLALFVFQLVLTCSDIYFREPIRFQRMLNPI